jgi:hypothetical protein
MYNQNNVFLFVNLLHYFILLFDRKNLRNSRNYSKFNCWWNFLNSEIELNEIEQRCYEREN